MRKVKLGCVVLAAAVLAASPLFAGGSGENAGGGAAGGGGGEITVYLVEHPLSPAVEAAIPEFTKATGVKVNISTTPETNYFDRVNSGLSSRSGTPDVFMSGIYQLWTYMQAGYVQPLDDYIAKAPASWDKGDFLPGVFNAMRWDGTDGHPAGQGPQLGLPLATEVYCLAYNKRAFDKAGITEVPATMDELIEAAKKLQGWNGPGSYGIAVRGIRDWGTIHPAYLSAYTMFGAKDFSVDGGKLVSRVNSPESIEFNKKFIQLVKEGGSPQWSSASWMQCQSDLGAGKAAMEWDATNNPIQVTLANMQEAGNIYFAPSPAKNPGDKVLSNLWVWGCAMNKDSKNKEAAWKFMQFITDKEFLLRASVESTLLDPVRQSVWDNPGFKAKYQNIPGYLDTFQKTAPNTSMLFTPQGNFMNTTTEWAATLQNMVAGGVTVEKGLGDLKAKVDQMVQ